MSGHPINEEILGGTSFAGVGSASALVIELLGSAGAACSITSWFVYAYRSSSIDAAATITPGTMHAKLCPTGSGTASVSTSASLFRRRGMPESTVDAAAVSAAVKNVAQLKPSATQSCLASTDAIVIARRQMQSSINVTASYTASFGKKKLLIPVAKSCNAVGQAECEIHIEFDSAIDASVVSTANLIRKIHLTPIPPDPTAQYAAFAVEVSNGPTPEERLMVLPYENRVMEASSMTLLGKFEQQPAETLDYEISFDEYLPSDDFIQSVGDVTVEISPTGGLFQVGPTILQEDSRSVKVWLSGGTDRVTYKITVTATTAQGRVKQNEFKVKIKDI